MSDDISENMQAILDHIEYSAIEREEKAYSDLKLAKEDLDLIKNIVERGNLVYIMIIRNRSETDGDLLVLHEISSSLKGLIRWAAKQYKKSGLGPNSAPYPRTFGVNIVTKPFIDPEKKNVGTLFDIPYELWSKEAELFTDDDWKKLFE